MTRLRRNRSFVGRGEPAGLADSAIRGRNGHRPDQQPVVAVSITVLSGRKVGPDEVRK